MVEWTPSVNYVNLLVAISSNFIHLNTSSNSVEGLRVSVSSHCVSDCSYRASHLLIRHVFPTATSPTTMTLATLKLVTENNHSWLHMTRNVAFTFHKPQAFKIITAAVSFISPDGTNELAEHFFPMVGCVSSLSCSYLRVSVFCSWQTALTRGWKPSLVCSAAFVLKHWEEERS